MSDSSAERSGKKLRIGVDLGGTKIEFVALEADGQELQRFRVPTPRGDYEATVKAVRDGALKIETELGRSATVGVGIPGTISGITRMVKNANSIWMNGKPFDKDLSTALGREVRCANDANCLAVSEATDGSGAGHHIVFAVILGTGCGGGIAVDGRVQNGRNGVAGEWGHSSLPWMKPDEYRLRARRKNKNSWQGNRCAFRSRRSRGACVSGALRRPPDAQPGATGGHSRPRHHRSRGWRFPGAAPLSQRSVAPEGARLWPRSRHAHRGSQAWRRQRRPRRRLALAPGAPLARHSSRPSSACPDEGSEAGTFR